MVFKVPLGGAKPLVAHGLLLHTLDSIYAPTVTFNIEMPRRSQNLRETFLHGIGLTASYADTLVTAVLSASCRSNLNTKVADMFLSHAYVYFSGIAVGVPVIIH